MQLIGVNFKLLLQLPLKQKVSFLINKDSTANRRDKEGTFNHQQDVEQCLRTTSTVSK